MLRITLAGALAALIGAAAGAAAATYLIDREPAPGLLPERWQRGVNLTAFLPDAYGEPQARRAMLTARAAGVERVALVPTWYMDSARSSAVARDPSKTPSDASLRTAARWARELGLEVALKPHVDVRDGTFRGEVAPAELDRWFASYRRMLLGYARLAHRIGAEALVVGTELTSMSLDPDPWRELINDVRELYDGPLTFAANWVEGAEAVEFWDRLDWIGIDAYMPLRTPTARPSVDELVDAWGPYEARMRALSDRWDRPVLFTELGYRSAVGTALDSSGAAGAPSERAQADAYEAAFEALSPERWFRGIWWWEWSAERLRGGPGGFTPEGKQAELVLAEWQGPPPVGTLSGSGRSGGSGSR